MIAALVRLAAGTSALVFASWTDLRWRRAPNHLWWGLAAVGVVVLSGEAVADPGGVLARWPYLVAAPLFALLVYAFWRAGLLAGGADAKALASLAILLPFPLDVAPGIPLLPSPMPGAFTVLGDSLLAVLVLPVAFLLRNVRRGHLRFPALFLGYRLPLDIVPETWCWPMEHPDPDGDGTVLHYLPSRGPAFTEETLDTLDERGVEEIWVTPKVPYMVPLALGYVLAFTTGDLLYAGLAAVL